MNLSAKKFEASLHLGFLNECLKKRGMKPTDLDFLPPTGYVVFYHTQPVCAGFMIKCDNKMAINTDLISDIDVPKLLRNDAVEYLRKTLYFDAKKDGIKLITVFTNIIKHELRLKSLGYIDIDKNLTQLGRFLWL